MAKALVSQEIQKLYRSGAFVDCSNFHSGSCEYKAWVRIRGMLKTFTLFYGPAHVLPVLIFKLRQLKKDPLPILKHTLSSVLRSVAFGSAIVGIVQYLLCQLNKIFRGIGRGSWVIIGILSSLPIFIEAKSRRGELTLYLLPRAIETVWNLMKKYGFPIRIKYFEVFLFGLAMGTLTYFLHNEDQHIKPTYRSSLKHIFGEN